MRLNLGAGGQRADGWTTLDRGGDVDILHDLTDLPLPIDNDCCEGVVVHHVLDLLPVDRIKPLLRDIARVVRPGGWVRVSGADLAAGVWAALNGSDGWFPEPRANLADTLEQFVTQGGARRTPLTVAQVSRLLTYCGFRTSARPCGESDGPSWLTIFDGRASESFFVEGQRCV